MYQLPLNPQQIQMLMGAANNPQQQSQMMSQFGLMNSTSPMGYFAAMESQLPDFLQFGPSVGMEAANQAKTRFLSASKPALAQSRANEFKYGGAGNSFALQRTAATKAAMNKDAEAVGQDARNAEIQRIIAMRQAYMGVPQNNFANFSPQQPMVDTNKYMSMGNSSAPPASGFERGMSIAKGVDNLLGGTLSNLVGNVGQNIGYGLQRTLQSPVNPFANLFKQSTVSRGPGFGGMSYGYSNGGL